MSAVMIMLSAVGGAFGFGARDVIAVKALEKLTQAGNDSAARRLLKMTLAVPVMPWESHGPRACLIGGFADILESKEESLVVVSEFMDKCKGLRPEVEGLVVYCQLRLFGSLQRHEEAYELFNQKVDILKASPNLHATALAMYFWDAYQAGRMAEVEPLIPEALQICKRYDESSSGSIMERSVHNAAGMIYRSLQRFDKAEEHLKESLRDKQDPGMLTMLADTYLQMGNLERARETFDEADSLGALPGSDHLYLMTLGKMDEAHEALRIYKENSPGLDDEANIRLRVSAAATEALIYLTSEDYQKAKDLLVNSLTPEVGEETFAAYSCWLAVAEAGVGESEEAKSRLGKLAPIEEKFPQNRRLQNTFLDTRRQLYYSAGEYQKAIDFSAKCLESSAPISHSKIYYQWAHSFKALGQSEKATEYLQKAADSVPDSRYAKLALQELEARS